MGNARLSSKAAIRLVGRRERVVKRAIEGGGPDQLPASNDQHLTGMNASLPGAAEPSKAASGLSGIWQAGTPAGTGKENTTGVTEWATVD